MNRFHRFRGSRGTSLLTVVLPTIASVNDLPGQSRTPRLLVSVRGRHPLNPRTRVPPRPSRKACPPHVDPTSASACPAGDATRRPHPRPLPRRRPRGGAPGRRPRREPAVRLRRPPGHATITSPRLSDRDPAARPSARRRRGAERRRALGRAASRCGPASTGRRSSCNVGSASTWRTIAHQEAAARQGRLPDRGRRDRRRTARSRPRHATGRRSSASRRRVRRPGARPTSSTSSTGATFGPAWEHRIQFYNPWGGRACSKGSPEAVSVADGALRLSSMPDPAGAPPVPWSRTRAGRPPRPLPLPSQRPRLHRGQRRLPVRRGRRRGCGSPGSWVSTRPSGCSRAASSRTSTTPWGAEIDVVEWYGARRGKEQDGHRRPRADARREQAPDRRPDRRPRPVPGHPRRHLVEQLPRVLGGVDPEAVRLPDRRARGLAHPRGSLGRATSS